MKRPTSYNTKQSEAILSYIASLNGAHVTVGQIAEHFEGMGISVGLTTIYRHLEKLVDRGVVRRYAPEGTGACYQYMERHDDCGEHFHLKCESCGDLLHLKCDRLDDVKQHISDEHAFLINTMKVVLYGKCEKCTHAGNR